MTLGHIPLTLADNRIHFDYAYQPSNQIRLPNEPFPKMSLSPLSFIESMSVSGNTQLSDLQQVQNCLSSIESAINIENTVSTEKNPIYVQLSAYPSPPSSYYLSDRKIATVPLPSINNEQN